MKYLNVIISLVFLVLIACAQVDEPSHHTLISINEQESKEALVEYFIHIPEMEIVSGKKYNSDLGGFTEQYIIQFKLPDTKTPSDWLAHLASSTDNDHLNEDTQLLKSSDYVYYYEYKIFDEFSGTDKVLEFYWLRYLHTKKIYEVEYLYPN